MEAASKHYEVPGVELSSFASDYARREVGLRILTGDVTDGGLGGEQFDVVTVWNAIEHMADPLGGLEGSRVSPAREPSSLSPPAMSPDRSRGTTFGPGT